MAFEQRGIPAVASGFEFCDISRTTGLYDKQGVPTLVPAKVELDFIIEGYLLFSAYIAIK